MMKPVDLLKSIRAGREVVNAHEMFAGLADRISEATFINDAGKEQRVRDVSDVKVWFRQLETASRMIDVRRVE